MATNPKDPDRPLDLASLRQKLAQKKANPYWRSLNELAERDEFIEMVQREYPRQASLLGSLSRRDFLRVMGSSLALAGLAACTPQPDGKILPYAKPPEELVAGEPVYFASAMPFSGYAQGVLVKSEMGRPIKVDGNPRHPITLGASDIFMQASILDLYDPDRAQQVTRQGMKSSWEEFTAAMAGITAAVTANIRILSGPVTSPSLNAQIQEILMQFYGAQWHVLPGVSRYNSQAGAQMVFGKTVDAQYRFDQADVILSLDCDFLFRDPGSLKYGREFSKRRQPIPDADTLNRLYVIESSMTLTGANADHRQAVKAGQIESICRLLANRLGLAVSAGEDSGILDRAWIEALTADLKAAGRNALVAAGERQPPAVHALAFAINQALGSIGTTVDFVEPVAYTRDDPISSVAALIQDLEAGNVDLLVILGENPVYSAPADLDLGEKISRAGSSVYLGAYADETAALVTWHIPAAHYLESWGDLRAIDGTTSLIQPLIEPLYEGKTSQEVLAVLLGQGDANGYDLLKAYWQSQLQADPFETTWKQSLSDGVISGTALQSISQELEIDLTGLPDPDSVPSDDSLEVVFEVDPTVWDGTYSNNAWLQELPKPLTKITWENAVLISPRLAERLNYADDDGVVVSLNGKSIQGGVLIQPGQPENSITLHLGYGRQAGGKTQEGLGFNAGALRESSDFWFADGAEIRATGEMVHLATTRDHQVMENRELVRSASLEEYLQNPGFAQIDEGDHLSFYDEVTYPNHAWGMAINLNTCTGCNACVLACQAENNIPTVGKDQVARSREMHWLRVDRYFSGDLDRPGVLFEPVPCMHCEAAPCEPVCPVEATSHSAEGVNEMTYNRCVGTRYCSNNCPYKVRRFNFYKYTDDVTESLKAMRNPDVTVRSRGVMEKCNYCIQRINKGRIAAEVAGREMQDGDVITACQQACPVNAIVFGDLNDPNSQVRQSKETLLNYALLNELGTRPRTTYLARVRNPNPSISEPV